MSSSDIISQIRSISKSQWQSLRRTDQTRLSGERHYVQQILAKKTLELEEKDRQILERFFSRFSDALENSLIPFAESLKCEFPDELPITQKIPEIKDALANHQVVIVCGATGSGKTTQLPKAALSYGLGRHGRIGCTQPRRIAASALASRFAQECDAQLGKAVGYKVRFDDHTSNNTVVKFMTDGILLAETRDDPNLLQYECVILDEVHERSLNIDFLLGYMKILLSKRQDFRLIVSSATLEQERLSAFFGNAPVIEVSGRLFPIEDCWFPPEEDDELSVSVARGTDFLTELDSSGDILVFLPGEQEIRDCAEYLSGRNYRNTEILPLFGRLSVSDQSKIFQRSSKRRIVLATNVAETSLTIPGIQYVVDSGLVRLSRFNPKSHIQELRLEMVSQASAKQRRGRCGRLMNGVCVHLYSEESFQDASPYTDPEILRSSLAGVILQMASLKLPAIQDFPFVDAPGLSLIKEGFQTLCDLQAIDKKQRLTKIGWELASYPIDPQLGRILLSAKRNKILSELIVIVSFLSIPDPRERPFEHAKEAETAQKQFLYEDSDFFTILNLWNAVHKELQTSNSALKRFCQKNYLNFRRIREWRNLKEDLQELYPDYPFCEIDTTDKIDYQSVHIALMSGLPRHLSCLKQGTKQYTDMTGRSCFIFPGSALTKRKGTPQWIMSFVWMETSKVFARCNAVIQPEWLETAAPHICTKSYDLMQWDEISGFVYAREKTHAGHLLIQPGRRCHYGAINPEKSREIFIREAFVSGCIRCPDIPWVQTYTKQFQQIKTLEFRMRKPDSIINSDALFEQFDLIFPEDFFSTAAIKQHWKQFHQEFIPDIRSYTLISPNNFNSKDFPDYLVFADVRFRLSYEYVPGEPNDGITLHARENDVNLLPRHVLEYIVPGYLSWKLDFCIRSMPKAIRKQLMPIEDCIHDFMEQYRACRINTEQPLMRAFSEFTENSYGVSVPDDMEQEDLPDYLRMKLAIHSQTDNTSVQIVYDMPKSNINNAKLSSEHVIAKQFEKWGLSDWPDSESLPDFLYLDKGKTKKGYPALVPDVKNRKIGIGVFLDFDTAVKSHCDGIYQLYRQKQSHFIKFLKGQFDKKNDIKLTFFHSNPNWLDELINLSIADSMDGDLWNIRSNGILEKKMEKSLSGLNDILSEKILFLEKLCKEAAQIHRKLRNLPEDSFSAEDMRNELDFLFRDGFLNFSEAFSQYGRYLKSLSVRLDRAILSPQKDFDKSQWISAYIRKFQLVADMDRPLESMQELSQFFLLLEEARISAFTPELRTRVKVSPQILSDAWEKLKM